MFSSPHCNLAGHWCSNGRLERYSAVKSPCCPCSGHTFPAPMSDCSQLPCRRADALFWHPQAPASPRPINENEIQVSEMTTHFLFLWQFPQWVPWTTTPVRYIAPNGKHCLLLRLWDLCESTVLYRLNKSRGRDTDAQPDVILIAFLKLCRWWHSLWKYHSSIYSLCMHVHVWYVCECWTVCIDQTTTFGSWCVLFFQHVWVPGLMYTREGRRIRRSRPTLAK